MACGTWADVVKSSLARSLDMAVEPLHLLPSAFAMSVGFTSPLRQACAPPLMAGVAGAGAAACAGWAFKCFLSGVSVSRPATATTTLTHLRRLLSSMTHLIPSMVQLEHVTSPSAVT